LLSPHALKSTDILHVHSAGPAALGLLLRHVGPKVISAHLTADSFMGSIEYAEYFRGAIERYLRFFYGQADLVLAVSAGTGSYLQDQLRITRPIRIMSNTIDGRIIATLQTRRAELRTKFGWLPGRPVILGVGQIQPRKGIDDFVEVARALPYADFVWVGGFLFGPLSADRRRLNRVIGSAPGNLAFTGPVPRALAYEYYAAADIFLSPARQETFGLAALEASMAGLPVILRDLPSYREIFRDAYIPVADKSYVPTILALLNDHEKLTMYKKRARTLADSYESATRVGELLAAYRLVNRLASCRLHQNLR
jgi:1,2-diacylglycerol-3-alpha-glucose alpha-1,2-galactosyltransferase